MYCTHVHTRTTPPIHRQVRHQRDSGPRLNVPVEFHKRTRGALPILPCRLFFAGKLGAIAQGFNIENLCLGDSRVWEVGYKSAR